MIALRTRLALFFECSDVFLVGFVHLRVLRLLGEGWIDASSRTSVHTETYSHYCE